MGEHSNLRKYQGLLGSRKARAQAVKDVENQGTNMESRPMLLGFDVSLSLVQRDQGYGSTAGWLQQYRGITAATATRVQPRATGKGGDKREPGMQSH